MRSARTSAGMSPRSTSLRTSSESARTRTRSLRERCEKFVAPLRKLGPQRAGGDLVLRRRGAHRYDHVAFDLNDAPSGLGCDARAPCPLRPQVPAIADHERRALRERDGDVVRSAAANDESQSARVDRLRGLGETLEHERVVARIGLRVVVGQAEADDDRKRQPVRLRYGHLQRRVELRALRLLHPVQHVVARSLRRLVEFDDALGLDPGFVQPDAPARASCAAYNAFTVSIVSASAGVLSGR